MRRGHDRERFENSEVVKQAISKRKDIPERRKSKQMSGDKNMLRKNEEKQGGQRRRMGLEEIRKRSY